MIERFGAAGIPRNGSRSSGTPSSSAPHAPRRSSWLVPELLRPDDERFEAAEAAGRAADLQGELEILFKEQNHADGDSTSIPATFLRVTVNVD